MNKYRDELFDGDEKVYIYKRDEPSIFNETSLKEYMISNENIKLITRGMLSELDLDSKLKFSEVQAKVIQYMNSWVNLGKLDDKNVLENVLQYDMNVASDYLNQLFIDTFKENFYEVKDFYTEDLNPFKVTKNGKLHKDMMVDDYRNLDVQSQQNAFNIYQQFSVRDNKIKHYNILGKGRNYDRKDQGGLNSSGYDKTNLVYKSYGDASFKELVKYEDHNSVFKHLPWQSQADFY